MGGNDEGAKGADDGVLAFQDVDQGVEGVVVNGFDGHGRGKGMVAALASQDRHLEACIYEAGKNGGAEVASCLCFVSLRLRAC